MTITRDEAAAKARELLDATVRPHVDPELEGDDLCGGFAFVAGDNGVIIGHRGGYQTSALELSGETIETLIIGWLAEQRRHYGVEAPAAVPGEYACPICGRSIAFQDRYPAAVCTDCQQRAADRHGRRIVGHQEGLADGLIVFYAESPGGPQSEIAGEVMETGRCWIDGIECSIEGARFGGVVVQRLTPPS